MTVDFVLEVDMAEITAAAVKALRDRTGLPMMDCKKALEEAGGDAEAAVVLLRKAGKKSIEKRADKETAFGRIGLYADFSAGAGAMVELLCESAPVAKNQEFIALANALSEQLALGPGASSPEELLDQPAPGAPGQTLRAQFEDLNHRIRELFRVGRMARVSGPCAGYVHHDGAKSVLLEVQGGNAELARDICMHIVAIRPLVVAPEHLDPALVAKEREILMEQARQEGKKPDNIIEKIVQGRMKSFFAQHCLLEQPFVKDSNQTVGQVARAAGMTIVRFIRWELGKEE